MAQFGTPVFSCAKQVAATPQERFDSLDGIVTRGSVERTGAAAWIRNADPPVPYVFSEVSLAPDDGFNVVRPLDVAPLSPGRWLRQAGAVGSCDNVNIYTLNVSPVKGNDATGTGSLCQPFKTIAAANAAIPPHGNDFNVWANEKYVLGLGPGRYTEPLVTLRQKRRCISLQGDGAIIESPIEFVQNIADWPSPFVIGSMPSPWGAPPPAPGGIGSPLVTWEIQGIGGGMEGGQTADNLIFLGKMQYRWDGATGGFQSYVMIDRTQFEGNFEITSAAGAAVGLTMEVNDSSFRAGVLGYDPAGSGGIGVLLKASNSQLLSRIGPNMTLLEIDTCRFGDINRLLAFDGVTPAAGTILTSIPPAPPNEQYLGITDCGFDGTVYNIGKPAGPSVPIMIDWPSQQRLYRAGGLALANCSLVCIGTSAPAGGERVLGGPVAAVTARGFIYYDTTLNRPVWREPASITGWVDAAGLPV